MICSSMLPGAELEKDMRIQKSILCAVGQVKGCFFFWLNVSTHNHKFK